MSIKSLGHIGLRQETEFGEETSSPEVFDELLEETMKMNNNFILQDVARGLRYQMDTSPGYISASGVIDMNFKPEGAIAWILKGLLGEVVSEEVASGVYGHTFIPVHSNKLPSFCLDMFYEDSGQTWMGCTFSDATLFVTKNQMMELSLNVISQRPKEINNSVTPIFPDIPPFAGHSISFNLGGESNVNFESFSVSIKNNVTAVHALGGKRWCCGHCAHKFEVEGTITLEFETEAERRRMWGSLTAIGPELTIEPCCLTMTAIHTSEITAGHNYSLILDMPEIYFESAPANIRRDNDRILQTLSFFPVYSKSVGKYMDIVLKNSESNYPNPE